MPTGKPKNPPDWEQFDSGSHPAFKKLPKKEMERLALQAIEEAKQFTDGPAARFASESQKFLSQAESRRAHHQASVELFKKTGDSDEENKHRIWLAEALLDLGQFTEARAALRAKSGIVDDDLYAYIEEVKKACSRSDSAMCKCEREAVETEVGKQTVTLELDRRFALRPIYSPAHGQVVTLYKCRHCDFMNATLEPPERQANYTQIRAEANRAHAAGEKPMVAVSDVQILKAS